MGQRGPRPKPTEERAREGTLRPDRHVAPVDTDALPALTADDLDFIPPRVAASPGGAEAWQALVDPMKATGIFRASDLPALGMAAMALARYWRAADLVDSEGFSVTGAQGGVVKNPALSALEKAEESFMRWCMRFGWSPSDRASLGMALLAGQKKAAAWAELDDDGDDDPE